MGATSHQLGYLNEKIGLDQASDRDSTEIAVGFSQPLVVGVTVSFGASCLRFLQM